MKRVVRTREAATRAFSPHRRLGFERAPLRRPRLRCWGNTLPPSLAQRWPRDWLTDCGKIGVLHSSFTTALSGCITRSPQRSKGTITYYVCTLLTQKQTLVLIGCVIMRQGEDTCNPKNLVVVIFERPLGTKERPAYAWVWGRHLRQWAAAAAAACDDESPEHSALMLQVVIATSTITSREQQIMIWQHR